MPPQADEYGPILAYHLTFTTYGTWLHGDERWSVDRKSKDIDRKYVPPNSILHEYMEGQLKHPKVKLDARARRIAREAIEDYCKFKGWQIHAINVRTNHVHLVVEAAEPASLAPRNACVSRCGIGYADC